MHGEYVMQQAILSLLASCVMSSEIGRTTCRPEEHHSASHALLQFSVAKRNSKTSSHLPVKDADAVFSSFYGKAVKDDHVSFEETAKHVSKKGSKLRLVHITKTGGTALEAWGGEHGLPWGYLWKELEDTKYGSPIRDTWHTPPMLFRWNPFAEYEAFAVIRDPYARMISEFRCPWWGFGGRYGPGEFWNNDGDTVEQWDPSKREGATVEDLNTWLQAKLYSGAARPPFHYGHFIPQHFYIFGPDGNRIIKEENLLRAEHLDEDFKAFKIRYDLSGGPLEHINSSDMRNFKVSDLWEDTRKLIEEQYWEDFERLGYLKFYEWPESWRH